jgi:purine-binding chemotaxis protein CheW
VSDGRQLCTFFIDGALFGVDVMHVQEVVRYREMTRVPLAPAVVRGLMNLRGQIVTALDMRTRLGIPARADDGLPVAVIVRSGGGIVSLLVDEIGDVVEVADDLFETTPETLSSHAKTLIAGVYKLHPQLLLVLDSTRATKLDANTGAT